MKAFQALAVIALFGACYAWTVDEDHPEFIYTLNDNGEIVKEYLNTTVKAEANDRYVKYYYFSKRTTSLLFQSGTTAILKNSDFDPAKQTVFVIHGWTNNHRSSINREIRTALLAAHDCNVIIVDWSPISRLDYITAQANVGTIGKLVAGVITTLIRDLNLDLNRVTLVGFSLGAHVAGIAGKQHNGRIANIVGLDPAGPGFTLLGKSSRLDSSDAQYVQVIHTNAGGLGIRYSIGDCDFWPNGGKTQAGCALDLTGTSSHNRAFSFYAESVGTRNRFNARACSSYANYQLNLCALRESSLFGGLTLQKCSGDFYLTTSALSPYGRG